MRQFARVSFDDVTVGDIAEAAEMTPAAVYYHFAGKEQILLEGTRLFTNDLIEVARSGIDDELQIGELMIQLFEYIRRRRTSASVYFINSAGLNLALEAHRKIVRAELTELFTVEARQTRGRLTTAEAGVMGAALVSLLEVSAVSMLSRDLTYKGLGARRMPTVVAGLANRIVGLDA